MVMKVFQCPTAEQNIHPPMSDFRVASLVLTGPLRVGQNVSTLVKSLFDHHCHNRMLCSTGHGTTLRLSVQENLQRWKIHRLRIIFCLI